MHIINLVHSLPYLDLSTAILLELRARQQSENVSTIFHFGSSTRAKETSFLFRTICHASDKVYAVGTNSLYENLHSVCTEKDADFQHLMNWGRLSRVLDSTRPPSCLTQGAMSILLRHLLSSIHEKTLLLRSHADISPLSQLLGKAVRSAGGQVHVILEGCYPPHDSLPLSYFHSARPDLADKFLIFTDGYRAPLESVGYRNFALIGYPKLYASWHDTIRSSQNLRDFQKQVSAPPIVLLTRGETVGGGPQIMPNETLTQILESVVREARSAFPTAPIAIKPHPGQDRSPIEALCRKHENVFVTEEHPSVLACAARMVVTTWSTSIFDALALGAPSVEYFIPNSYFLKVYPGGSAFKRLGIPSVETSEQFGAICRDVAEGRYRQPNIAALFEDRGNGGAISM